MDNYGGKNSNIKVWTSVFMIDIEETDSALELAIEKCWWSLQHLRNYFIPYEEITNG